MNSTVDQAAFTAPYLHLVTPDDADLHVQLISDQKRDKVHPVRSLEHLVTTRLGYSDSSKRCFALIRNAEDGARDIMAAIYTYWSVPDDHEEAWKMLPGKVSDILREPSYRLTEPAKVVTFYSISSFGENSGKLLISNLHQAFRDAGNPPILTTLSPLRTFAKWVNETGQAIDNSVDAFRKAAATYLGLKQDPVQRFHMRNGAYIGAIHPYANEAGTRDAEEGLGVMISYRYPRTLEALEANLKDYTSGALPSSGHLRPFLGG